MRTYFIFFKEYLTKKLYKLKYIQQLSDINNLKILKIKNIPWFMFKIKTLRLEVERKNAK